MQNRNKDQPLSKFTIAQLTDFVEEFTGHVGVLVFAIGFIAAALSSQLATPLGATATAESIFFMPETVGENEIELKEVEELEMLEKQEPEPEIKNQNEKATKRNIKIMKQTTNFVMVAIATVVISTNVDRILVILVAQVFNGCLLPIFSVCLLLCINDHQFMGSAPQKEWSNTFLVISVTFTIFLASNVLVQKVLSSVLVPAWHQMLAAACLAVGGILTVCITTGLGKILTQSLRG